MKWKAVTVVAAAAGFAIPSPAHACDWYLSSYFLRVPSKLTLGLGIQVQPNDGTTLIPSADLGIGLADRVVVMPAVGLCHESDDFGDLNEMIYGAAAGVKLFSNGKVTVNAQTGVSIVKYGDYDETDTTIPIVAAAEVAATDNASIFLGGGMEMAKYKGDGFSESNSDPILFGGVTLKIKNCAVSGGIGLKIGDEDTNMALNFALKLPLGGG